MDPSNTTPDWPFNMGAVFSEARQKGCDPDYLSMAAWLALRQLGYDAHLERGKWESRITHSGSDNLRNKANGSIDLIVLEGKQLTAELARSDTEALRSIHRQKCQEAQKIHCDVHTSWTTRPTVEHIGNHETTFIKQMAGTMRGILLKHPTRKPGETHLKAPYRPDALAKHHESEEGLDRALTQALKTLRIQGASSPVQVAGFLVRTLSQHGIHSQVIMRECHFESQSEFTLARRVGIALPGNKVACVSHPAHWDSLDENEIIRQQFVSSTQFWKPETSLAIAPPDFLFRQSNETWCVALDHLLLEHVVPAAVSRSKSPRL